MATLFGTLPDGRAYAWRQLNEEAEEKRTID